MVSIEPLATLIAFSDAIRCNTKRQVPVESSKIILCLEELDLVSQTGSAGTYTVFLRETETGMLKSGPDASGADTGY